MSPRECFAGSGSAITYTAFLREPGGFANANFVAAAATHGVTGKQVWACVGADWSEILL